MKPEAAIKVVRKPNRAGNDLGGRILCLRRDKCGTCGVVSRCQPDFDFYGSNGEPLKCERCFRAALAEEGLHFVNADTSVCPRSPQKMTTCPLGSSKAALADWRRHAAKMAHAKIMLELRETEERVLKHKHGVEKRDERELQGLHRRALALAEALKLIEATNRKLRI